MYRKFINGVLNHPKGVLGLIVLATVALSVSLPWIQTDTKADRMLPEDAAIRILNDQVERQFDLQDFIVVGVVNDAHANGVLNPQTLGKLQRITGKALKLPGIVRRNVYSFATSKDLQIRGGSLVQQRLLRGTDPSAEQIQALEQMVDGNPLFEDLLLSKDRSAAAIYLPVPDEVDAKGLVDQIKQFIREEGQGDERFYIGGQRVAEDVFGVLMFQQMALLSPLVGLVIFIGLWLMFRRLSLITGPLLIALVSVLWTMGLMVWLRLPVHIMASMAPVFLMSIGVVDGIHILSEFSDRFTRTDKRQAILDVMLELKLPLLYTSLTTMVGFASLAFTPIPPVQVFGLFVAFGIGAAWLLTIMLLPAFIMLLDEAKLHQTLGQRGKDRGLGFWSRRMGGIGAWSLKYVKPIVLASLVLISLSVYGLGQIRLNDSPVWWFKPGESVRQATETLNQRLGGTSLLYLVGRGEKDAFKRPDVLAYLERLQRYIEQNPLVGKTTSLADAVKRINFVWNDRKPQFAALPDSREAVAQLLLLFLSSSSSAPSDLQDFVDITNYDQTNLIVQLKDNGSNAMDTVVRHIQAYLDENRLHGIEFQFAGPGHFNDRWNVVMFKGMSGSLMSAFGLVLLLLMFNFRSWRWGVVAILPLGLTVLLSYGLLGLFGVGFTMPIEVISALSLGMSVDFAIHFVERFRQRYGATQDLKEAINWTMFGPGKAIVRNAVILFMGFIVLWFAPLTPYITVGLFIAAIMVLSSVTTLILLPALIKLFEHKLLPQPVPITQGSGEPKASIRSP